MLTEVSQDQAGIGKKLRVYPEQLTRLAKPLSPAPQEPPHCLVSLPNPVKHHLRRKFAATSRQVVYEKTTSRSISI
jgi:hypothetical protein